MLRATSFLLWVLVAVSALDPPQDLTTEELEARNCKYQLGASYSEGEYHSLTSDYLRGCHVDELNQQTQTMKQTDKSNVLTTRATFENYDQCLSDYLRECQDIKTTPNLNDAFSLDTSLLKACFHQTNKLDVGKIRRIWYKTQYLQIIVMITTLTIIYRLIFTIILRLVISTKTHKTHCATDRRPHTTFSIEEKQWYYNKRQKQAIKRTYNYTLYDNSGWTHAKLTCSQTARLITHTIWKPYTHNKIRESCFYYRERVRNRIRGKFRYVIGFPYRL